MKALVSFVCTVTLAAPLLVSASIANAAPGDLDPSFGNAGKVITDLGWGGLVAQANDVVIDPTGRIYVVGTDVGTTGSEILDPPFDGSSEVVPVVAAYSPAGSLLWKHGFQQRPIPCDLGLCANNTYGNAALIHPFDQSLVVAGFDDAADTQGSFNCGSTQCISLYVMRVNADGDLITPQLGQHLNTPWQRTVNAETCCTPVFANTSVAVAPDGDIVVGTSLRGPDLAENDQNFVVARFDWPSGEVDTTFGTNGLVVTDLGTHTDDRLQKVLMQPDGKILATGSSRSQDASATDDFALVRYEADGAIDSTFGDSGRVLTDFASGADQATGIAIQPDGKIVLGGTVTALVPELNSYWPHWGVARYETDGLLDTSFGDAGRSVTSFHCPDLQCVPNQAASDLGIGSAGRIVLSGWAVDAPQGARKFAVARYLDNGVLDTSFGVTGKVTTTMQGEDDPAEATSLAIDQNGIVIAGTVATAGALGGVPRRFAVARYLDGDGVPACADGIDNDGDGLTDLADRGCESSVDDDETDPPCDGITTAEVRGPSPPSYLDLPPPELALFLNDDAVCEAIWAPFLDDGFVPQGLALRGDKTALVSGYVARRFRRDFCRIVHVDLETGIQLDTRDFRPRKCEHAGGISIDPAQRIWLADTHRLILLNSGLQDSTPKPIVLKRLHGSFLVDPDAEHLLIGDFDREKLYQYTYDRLLDAARDGRQIGPSVNPISLPKKPQGGDFKGADLWITSSTARCGKLTNLGPDPDKSFGFGPGAEEFEFDFDGSLWAVFEAGTKKYANRPFFPVIARFDLQGITEAEECEKF